MRLHLVCRLVVCTLRDVAYTYTCPGYYVILSHSIQKLVCDLLRVSVSYDDQGAYICNYSSSVLAGNEEEVETSLLAAPHSRGCQRHATPPKAPSKPRLARGG